MRKNWACFFIFVLLLTVAITGCQREKQVEENKKINVEVFEVELKDITELITVTAQLRPYEEAIIIPKTPGLNVTNLAVEVGDKVKKDEYLFELDKGIIRKQVEQAKLLYDAAKENYQFQKEQVNKLQQQSIPVLQMRNAAGLEGITDINTMKASLAAANVQMEQARIVYSTTLEQLKEMEYTSPIDGVITQINVKKDQMVLQTAPAMVVSNINKLKAYLPISNSLIKELKTGQSLILYNDEKHNELGSITLINPVADPRTNLYTVEAVFDNREGGISSGSFYKLDIIKNHKDNVLVIPKEALISEALNSYVFVEVKGEALKRRITTGVDGGQEIEVTEGLSVGERVIVKGHQFLGDKAEVFVRGDDYENN